LNAHCGAGGFAWRAADGELYGRSIALLRPCRERPCGRRAAEQRDELAPFLIELHPIPHAERGRTAGYRIGSDQSAAPLANAATLNGKRRVGRVGSLTGRL